MEQWKKQQEKSVEEFIGAYIREHTVRVGDKEYPPAYGWTRWAKDYICNAFKYVESRPWLEAFVIQPDDSIFMTRHGKAAQEHLIKIRNYARRYNDEKHLGNS